jgi:hypothetical protein
VAVLLSLAVRTFTYHFTASWEPKIQGAAAMMRGGATLDAGGARCSTAAAGLGYDAVESDDSLCF